MSIGYVTVRVLPEGFTFNREELLEYCKQNASNHYMTEEDMKDVPYWINRYVEQLEESHGTKTDGEVGVDYVVMTLIQEYLEKHGCYEIADDSVHSSETFLVTVPMCKQCAVINKLKDET